MSCSLVPAAPARRRRTWTTYPAEYVKPTRCMSYSSSYPEKRAPADGTYCGQYMYMYMYAYMYVTIGKEPYPNYVYVQ